MLHPKRKYHGKRKSINDDTVVQVEDQGAHSSINSAPELVEDGAATVYCEATTTASSSKILDIGSESHPSGYRLMDVNILDGIFNCLACPECYEVETLHLNDTNAKKKGLARLMYLKCNSFTNAKEFYTSKNVVILSKKGEESYGGQPSYSGGMKAFGVGYTPLKKLCCYLNMPEPMSSDDYDNISKTVKDVTKVVAEKSMADAAKEVKGENEVILRSVLATGYEN